MPWLSKKFNVPYSENAQGKSRVEKKFVARNIGSVQNIRDSLLKCKLNFRAATVMARNYCELYSLAHKDLKTVLLDWPEVANEFELIGLGGEVPICASFVPSKDI